MLIGRWKQVSRNQVRTIQEESNLGKTTESQVFEGNHIMGKGVLGLNWSQLAMPVMVSVLCQTVAMPAYADLGATNATKNDRHTAEEANIFFSKLAKDSANPIIANLAQENVKKLAEKSENYTQLANAPSFADNVTSKSTHSVSLVTQANNSLAVPTIINRKTMGTFVLDTGATYTVITPRLARKLGVTVATDSPKVAIATANGVIQAPVVTLNSVTIGDVEVNNVQAIVQNLGDDLLLVGLLGMNFFKGMDMSVRQDKLILGVNQ